MPARRRLRQARRPLLVGGRFGTRRQGLAGALRAVQVEHLEGLAQQLTKGTEVESLGRADPFGDAALDGQGMFLGAFQGAPGGGQRIGVGIGEGAGDLLGLRVSLAKRCSPAAFSAARRLTGPNARERTSGIAQTSCSSGSATRPVRALIRKVGSLSSSASSSG